MRQVVIHPETRKQQRRYREACLGVLLAVFFLTGCLTSEEPLITKDTVYPFQPGTVLQEYEVSGGSMRPKTESDGRIRTLRLEIEDGFYRGMHPNSSTPRFRLAKVTNSPFFILMSVTSESSGNSFAYTLLEKKGDYYISHVFLARDFLRYQQHMKEKAPGRWALYTAQSPWKRVSDNRISISSLAFLEIILPEMLAGGFGTPGGTAYKVIHSGGDPLGSAVRTAPRSDHEKRERLERACNDGNAAGCTNLGVMVARGEGGVQDFVRARALYDEGCKGGSSIGCFNLGVLVRNGEGGPRDFVRARVLYDQACRGGYAAGCYNLGLMVRNGEGGSRDLPRAQVLFEQACEIGFARACSLLEQ